MWPLGVSPALVHGAFLISLDTTAGLIAVWAALSRRHRVVRAAGFCVLPAGLWLASAQELARDVVVLMAIISVAIHAASFAAAAPYGRTYARLPRLRFGLGTLFYTIFLMALTVAAGSLLAPLFERWETRHFFRFLLEAAAPSLAILGATYFAYGKSGWKVRLAAFLAGGTAGGLVWWALLVWSPVTPGMFELFVIDYSELPFNAVRVLGFRVAALVPLVPGIVGFLAAIVLWVWRSNMSSPPAPAERSMIWRVSRAARPALRAAVTGALVLPTGYMCYELVRPVPTPQAVIPVPNGYEQLVLLGQQFDVAGLEPARRAELLAEARRCLKTPSWVKVDYFEAVDVSEHQALRALARGLVAEGDAQHSAGDVDSALQTYQDVLALADRGQRGGVAIHAIVASAIEGGAIERLTNLAPDLSAEQCRATGGQLLAYDLEREPMAEILRRDDVHSHLCFGWVGRWVRAVENVAGTRTIASFPETMHAARDRDHARLRVRACDLAIQGFLRQRGHLPQSLDELSPEFLPRLPLDPYDAAPVKLTIEAGAYTVFTIEGGTGGIGNEGPFAITRQNGGD
jgi:hypothetical protein